MNILIISKFCLLQTRFLRNILVYVPAYICIYVILVIYLWVELMIHRLDTEKWFSKGIIAIFTPTNSVQVSHSSQYLVFSLFSILASLDGGLCYLTVL